MIIYFVLNQTTVIGPNTTDNKKNSNDIKFNDVDLCAALGFVVIVVVTIVELEELVCVLLLLVVFVVVSNV